MAYLYTWEEFPKLMNEARDALEANLTSAAYLSRVLGESQMPHGFMGGYALNLWGSARSTTDIDIAVQATILQIQEILVKDNRRGKMLDHPKGPTASVLRLFVLADGNHDDFNVPASLVEMDLIFNGSLGVPVNIASGAETIDIETVSGRRSYPVLNIHNQMLDKEQRKALIGEFRGKNPHRSQGVAKLKEILGIV
ncbi:hypothetical protein AJ79_03643 [Helicocarpus griseus UAMH5409]|uniref:Uncharacterized protein n=1 Tax=Helicocarpus griseus UAMH5409 TaxID=1447875 RepID=A0A2B7XY13_9EURO|nr:hypothetical protein AJ79_03643 [Helicocarpus griseus UAMH5409]